MPSTPIGGCDTCNGSQVMTQLCPGDSLVSFFHVQQTRSGGPTNGVPWLGTVGFYCTGSSNLIRLAPRTDGTIEGEICAGCKQCSRCCHCPAVPQQVVVAISCRSRCSFTCHMLLGDAMCGVKEVCTSCDASQSCDTHCRRCTAQRWQIKRAHPWTMPTAGDVSYKCPNKMLQTYQMVKR